MISQHVNTKSIGEVIITNIALEGDTKGLSYGFEDIGKIIDRTNVGNGIAEY